MLIEGNNNTLLNDLELYINKILKFNIDFYVFYGKITLKKNKSIGVFEIGTEKNIVLFNNIFNEKELNIFFDEVKNFFIINNLNLDYLNIAQYFGKDKILFSSKLERIEFNRKLYEFNKQYFINKNKLLFKILDLRKVKYFLNKEDFYGLNEILFRMFDYKKEYKFLYIDYLGYLNNKKYIIKGCFNRLLDIINVFDGYLLFKICGLNVPKEYFYIKKKYSIYDYYFTVFSFIDGNNFTLKDLYEKKGGILDELYKLNENFFIKKICDEININQSLNMIPGDCKEISSFSKKIYYTYGYFNLDICHFMYNKKDNIYIIDYNKINFSPFILIYLYIIVFFISIDFCYKKNFNIDNNIILLNNIYGNYIKEDLEVIEKLELKVMLHSIILGMDLDFGENINYKELRLNLNKNKNNIIYFIYK